MYINIRPVFIYLATERIEPHVLYENNGGDMKSGNTRNI